MVICFACTPSTEAKNLAVGKPYWFYPRSLVEECRDELSHPFRLTDGVISSPDGPTDKQKNISLTWEGWSPYQTTACIVIDLKQENHINKIRLHGVAGWSPDPTDVFYPFRASFYVSGEDLQFYHVGDVEDKPNSTSPYGLPWHWMETPKIAINGRYVCVMLQTKLSQRIRVDELEIIGEDSPVNVEHTYRPVNIQDLFLKDINLLSETRGINPVQFGDMPLYAGLNLKQARSSIQRAIEHIKTLNPPTSDRTESLQRLRELTSRLNLLQTQLSKAQSEQDVMFVNVESRKIFDLAQHIFHQDRPLFIWARNIWEPLMPLTQPCLNQEPLEQIRLVMLGNEYESLGVAITNFGLETVRFRLLLGEPEKVEQENIQTPATFPLDHATLRQMVYSNCAANTLVGDALIKLDEGNTITLPSGETVQVWLTLHARDLKPGHYAMELRVIPLQAGVAEQSVSVRIRISPVALEGDQPVHCLCFAYPRWYQMHPEPRKCIEDIIAHYCDTVVFSTGGTWAGRFDNPKMDDKGNIIVPPSGSMDDALKLIEGVKNLFVIGYPSYFELDGRRAALDADKELDPGFETAYINWLKWLIGEIRSQTNS